MSDLFGTPEGKREEHEEWRVVVTSPSSSRSYRPQTDRAGAERSGHQYAPWVQWHIEHRTVTTYTTRWAEVGLTSEED